MLFFELDSVREQYRANKVKMLAVTTAVRIASGPEGQTMEEAGVKDFRSDSWNALAAPPKTPAAIIAKLNDAINAVLKEPQAAGPPRSMSKWRGVCRACIQRGRFAWRLSSQK